MSELTVEDLFEALVESAGESEVEVAPVDSLDLPFADIGYDSLALLEAAAELTKRTGVRVDDDRLLDARTPRHLLDLFNQS